MPLKPGADASWAHALDDIAKALGSDAHVSTADADLDRVTTRDDALFGIFASSPASQAGRRAVAMPTSSEEVAALLRIAAARQLIVYPCHAAATSGLPAAPPRNAIAIDFRRMNRILDLDGRYCTALVEPGVTFGQLAGAIRAKGLPLWVDDRLDPENSVIGAALDRAHGFSDSPYRDLVAASCGLEVVLPDGTLLRTGMGALPNAPTWQSFRYGYGPHVDGLFAQSNFGLVTKMGFWLMPRPESVLDATVTAPRHADLAPLVDTLAALTSIDLVKSFTCIDRPQGSGSDGAPYWALTLRLFGPSRVVAAKWAHVQKRFGAAISGAGFALGGGPPPTPPAHDTLSFSPIVPMNGASALQALALISDRLAAWGLAETCRPSFSSCHQRTLQMRVSLPLRADIAANRQQLERLRQLIALTAAQGWAEYRTRPALMADCTGTMAFNDHALMRLQRNIKDALDPAGILAPGAYGIWPGGMAEQRSARA